MKKYPVDHVDWIIYWPLKLATRSRSKALKASLMLAYIPWSVTFMVLLFPVLAVSIMMEMWDSLNEQS